MDIPVNAQSAHNQSLVAKPRAFALPRHWTDVIPVVLAYLPIAFAFGLSAREAGMSLIATAGMSIFVFAGCAQMIAVALFAAGQPLGVIVFTTFMVNLRMVLLATTLAPKTKGWPLLARIWFGLELTDESFALISARCGTAPPSRPYVFTVQPIAHLAWITGTVLGYVLGEMVFDVKALGLDFALAGMLIGMVALLVRTRIQWVVGICSAVVSVFFTLKGLTTYGVLFAALGGPTLGLWLQKIAERRHANN